MLRAVNITKHVWTGFCCAFFLLPMAVFAQIEPRFPDSHITSQQLGEYLKEVRAIPDVQCKQDSHYQLICDSAKETAIWVFTVAGHPAHPAATEGIMVVQDGAIGIDRIGYYAGERAPFDVWFQQFRILDQRQLDAWKKMGT